jgi:signal transduction histidine kinase
VPKRGRLAAVVAIAAFTLLMSMAAVTSLAAAVPPAVGAACVVGLVLWRPAVSSVATWLTAVPGAVSLGTTIVVLSTGQELSTADGLYGLFEVAVLFVLLAGVVRWLNGTKLWVCAALTAASQIAWIVRFLPDRDIGPLVAAGALWSIPSLVAITVGGYPRLAAARLQNSVANAREEQRRALERDMHDYVAHDLTGMIVQAQAARFAAGDDPQLLREALRRIEEAGQRAMSSMDRALELLRDETSGTEPALGRPGLEELEQLVADFRAAGTREVHLTVIGPIAALPREVNQTLYRVCVEALTNVRRHAATATAVEIELAIDADHATLTVRDDGRAPGSGGRSRARGGSGLRTARGRVEALGGTLTAAAEPAGWRVCASLPLHAT